jgi:uncharacterized protein YjeT (DUF2065 family)
MFGDWGGRGRREANKTRLAQGLGLFSIGLGLAELIAPRTIARALDMRGSENLLRFYGARELAAGMGILGTGNRPFWLWGRVAGDVVDIATLSIALVGSNRRKGNVTMALLAVLGVTALDVISATSLEAGRRSSRPVRDYSHRSGFPKSAREMVGAARGYLGGERRGDRTATSVRATPSMATGRLGAGQGSEARH